VRGRTQLDAATHLFRGACQYGVGELGGYLSFHFWLAPPWHAQS
jgi:hypothetical protein